MQGFSLHQFITDGIIINEVINMPTEKPRYTITVSDGLLKEIDDYRYENRFPTRTQATLELIRIGLETLKKESAGEKSDDSSDQ